MRFPPAKIEYRIALWRVAGLVLVGGSHPSRASSTSFEHSASHGARSKDGRSCLGMGSVFYGRDGSGRKKQPVPRAIGSLRAYPAATLPLPVRSTLPGPRPASVAEPHQDGSDARMPDDVVPKHGHAGTAGSLVESIAVGVGRPFACGQLGTDGIHVRRWGGRGRRLQHEAMAQGIGEFAGVAVAVNPLAKAPCRLRRPRPGGDLACELDVGAAGRGGMTMAHLGGSARQRARRL